MRPAEARYTSDELAKAVEGMVLQLVKATTDAVPDELAGIVADERHRPG